MGGARPLRERPELPGPDDSTEELVDASLDDERHPEAALDEPGREDEIELEEETWASTLD